MTQAENSRNGGPAFPVQYSNEADGPTVMPHVGMTLRQYAAIKLRVPNSGTDWLDEMIRQSLRDELAAKAMQGILSGDLGSRLSFDDAVKAAYKTADVTIKAREVK